MNYSWYNNGPIPVPVIEESDEETTDSSLPGEGDSPSNDPDEETPYSPEDGEFDLPEYPGLPDTAVNGVPEETSQPALSVNTGNQVVLLAVVLLAVIVVWGVLQ